MKRSSDRCSCWPQVPSSAGSSSSGPWHKENSMEKKENRKKFSVNIRPEILEAVDEKAEAFGVSRGRMIEILLKEVLRHEQE